MKNVFDAAGVRLVCPFIQDIDRTAELIRAIPGVQIQTEKDYIRSPKPNGYRSYHMILSMPLRFLGNSQKPYGWRSNCAPSPWTAGPISNIS